MTGRNRPHDFHWRRPGQAGLAAAFYLAGYDIPYAVLDKGKEVGEVWKRRYDWLTLFTPRNCSELPGMRLTGDPDGFPVKDEIAAALRRYAEDHQLNIRLETEVLALTCGRARRLSSAAAIPARRSRRSSPQAIG